MKKTHSKIPKAPKKVPQNKPAQNDKTVAFNRQAKFNYIILSTFSAGLVLKGSEVKSLRKGHCQLKDSYLVFKKEEPYIQKVHISPYPPASHRNHEPERKRKLLLNKHEIHKLMGQLKQKGLSCVPLKVYFKNGKAKMELALVKGKKRGDKREALKRKEMDRSARRAMKHHRHS